MEPPRAVVLQLAHPDGSKEDADQRHAIQAQLAEGQLGEGQFPQVLLGEQHKERGHRGDGRGENDNTQEQTLVALTAVQRAEAAGDGGVLPQNTDGCGWVSAHIAPHEVEDDGADECVLDAAREEVRRCHLHQLANEVRPGAIGHHFLPLKVPPGHIPSNLTAERLRSPHGDVLHLAAVGELVVGLVDEHVDPEGEVRANQMHQTNAGDDLKGIKRDFLKESSG